MSRVQPSKANNSDLLFPAHCASCSSLIGSHVRPVGSSPDEQTALRLLKYATYPVSSRPDATAFRHSLASYITAELLETGQAHACHRFVLENAEDEQARLLVRWRSFSLFRGDYRVLTRPAPTALVFQPGNPHRLFVHRERHLGTRAPHGCNLGVPRSVLQHRRRSTPLDAVCKVDEQVPERRQGLLHRRAG